MLLRGIHRCKKAISNTYIFGLIVLVLLGLTFYIFIHGRESTGTYYRSVTEALQQPVKFLSQDEARAAGYTSLPMAYTANIDHTITKSHEIALTTSDSLLDPDLAAADRFASRNQRIAEVCNRIPGSYVDSHRLYNKLEFFAKGHLKWCRVLKVASSFISQLNGNVSRETPSRGGTQLKTFMTVREPYSRLVSGYFDRILTFPPSWELYGSKIIQAFRPNATQEEIRCGRDVTFPEFIKYFIRGQETHYLKNAHFAPMSEACHPCRIRFDYTCHLETLKEDFTFLLKSINVTPHFDSGLSEGVFKAKVNRFMSLKSLVTRCGNMCRAYRTLWWSFQARGLLPKSLSFPFSEADCGNDKTGDIFGQYLWDTYLKYKGKFDKYDEIRKTIVELFLQVPLKERIKVKDLLAMDFELFGYEAQPDDIFPELATDKSSSGTSV